MRLAFISRGKLAGIRWVTLAGIGYCKWGWLVCWVKLAGIRIINNILDKERRVIWLEYQCLGRRLQTTPIRQGYTVQTLNGCSTTSKWMQFFITWKQFLQFMFAVFAYKTVLLSKIIWPKIQLKHSLMMSFVFSNMLQCHEMFTSPPFFHESNPFRAPELLG